MLKRILIVLSVVVSGCAAQPAFTYSNEHWQEEQDLKIMFCYQEAPAEHVEECLLALDVFI